MLSLVAPGLRQSIGTQPHAQVLVHSIILSHKKFGDGTVSWMSNDGKYIRIKFVVGEKQFVFPDSFVLGFLELK